MKKAAFIILIISFTLSLFSQNGWRKNEKEVKVVIENQSQAQKLHDLQYNTDFYNDHATLYVIPAEYEQLIESGFKCEVIIDDLNMHYQNYWENRDAYHSYQEIIDLIDSLATTFPSICTKTNYKQAHYCYCTKYDCFIHFHFILLLITYNRPKATIPPITPTAI